MKRIFSLVLMAVLFAAMAVPAGAAVDTGTAQYVVDDSNVLTSALEQTIIDANTDLMGNCSGATFRVVTVDRSPDGVTYEQYAREIYNGWGLGNSGQNIGMLLVVYTEDDTFFLEKGSGLNGLSTLGELDALLSDNSDFNKYLRQDMDAEGISWLLNKIVVWYYDNFHTSFLGSGYTASNSTQTQPGYTPPKRSGLGFGKLVLILLVLVLLVSPLWIRRKYNRWGVWPLVLLSPWWATRPGKRRGRLLWRRKPVKTARPPITPGNGAMPRNYGTPGMGGQQPMARPTARATSPYGNERTNTYPSRTAAPRNNNKRPSGFGRQK